MISLNDLFLWLTTKEKITNLEKERRSIISGITGLQRCREDFGNVGITEFNYRKEKANEGIEQISIEIKELQEKKEELESKIIWETP